MKQSLILTLITISLLLGGGCSQKVRYDDAAEVETTNADFGSTDLQQMAEKMVDSLLTFAPMVEITRDHRPIIFIDTVKNKSSEHIDTEALTDTISTRLLRSGQYRFVDMTKVATVRQQLQYQHQGGMVNEATAVKLGRQVGAEFMMYGNLSSIVKKADGDKDVYYKLTLKLMNLESGLVEWLDEKEIRKKSSRALFGL
ncbi:MAG: penicillin-binding protein activator LpoB [Gammaproteobacteria bacterium]|nr:penicillin-binding protein activator LpoB [Gammaproteobacteria bacterium]